MTRKEIIQSEAVELLKSFSNGIRYSELVNKIHEQHPNYPINTIHGTVWNLDTQLPDKIYKPARGIFQHVMYKEEIGKEQPIKPQVDEKIKEEAFYQPFADWIINELEECTRAIPLGGNKFKDKWGTPDVLGVREPKKSDIIKPPTEIVSAEIKVDTGGLITAFGQACSYKIFSHKSYIVVSKESSEEDKARLDVLCRIFGIGLILFNSNEPNEPKFEIRVRSNNNDPDMFYVNKYMKLVEEELF
jgi:hypothetical protein